MPYLRRYAEAHNWMIHQEYTEEESGGTAQRSAFQQLFADAHQRRFDLVLFWSLDRFSREGALPTLQHLNLLETYGVGYKSYSEPYLDSTGIFKDAVVSILAIVAKQERVRLSERTKAGMARVRASGKKLGPPSKSKEIIMQVRQHKANGASNQAIARVLGISPTTVAKYLIEQQTATQTAT